MDQVDGEPTRGVATDGEDQEELAQQVRGVHSMLCGWSLAGIVIDVVYLVTSTKQMTPLFTFLLQPPPRPGVLNTLFVFVTSFFTSLLPQQIPELQDN